MPKYRALYPGEIPGPRPRSVVYIQAGEEFDYEGKPGLWMQPVVEGEAIEPAAVPEKSPETFSEIGTVILEQRQANLDKLEGKRGPGRPRKNW